MTVATRPVRRVPRRPDTGSAATIRWARTGDHQRLTRMERSASLARLGHIFDPRTHPYPTAEVSRRWRDLLRDRLTYTSILEVAGEPAGFVAFSRDTVLHLGVPPERARRGHGSALLQHATAAIFAGGPCTARLWVLTENHVARRLYRGLGWRDTGRTRTCEFSPYPVEVELALARAQAPPGTERGSSAG